MGRKYSTSKRDDKCEVPFRGPVFRWRGNSKKGNGSVNWVKLFIFVINQLDAQVAFSVDSTINVK